MVLGLAEGELLVAVLPLPSLEGEETRPVVQLMPWFRCNEDYFSAVDADFFEETARTGVVDAAPGVAGEEFFSCVGFRPGNVSLEGVFCSVDAEAALKAEVSRVEQRAVF